ncbi:hypothetical protein CACET_c27180 [Clostridium aceticum]|uniref:Uncharacterized protein n=1 Tax=Clostridium aceticum TaxID=84022 RepID=A0A0D8I962_9CLOT|nr:hypothetical protein [Clostridium aceticum]AKL96163.1 hypothetical protein CACET_c27180 [Clostridium aceticum]KJF26584.1 hypothetical protein TZ02_11960 [Clostridium aceticum]
MNSKKKLSEIKSFARGKVYEFIDVAGAEILNQLVLSNFTLHLDNYSYGDYGGNLISIKLKSTVEIEFEKLERDIQNLCYEKKLGLYPTVDEEAMELQFFNKALNSHIKTYQLMKKDERDRISAIINTIKEKDRFFISDCIHELKQLVTLSSCIHVSLANNLIDDEDGSVLDDIRIEGIIQKVKGDLITLDNAYFARVIYQINIDEDWQIKSIGNWGSDNLRDIRVEIIF